MNCVELFAGAGGLALAASGADFEHEAVIEYNHDACETIRANQRRGFRLVQDWPLIEGDVHKIKFGQWEDEVDLVSGGPPCQPFSIGGKHNGLNDHRNLFPEAVRAVREIRPRAFVFENVRGLTRQSFSKYFGYIILQLHYPGLVRRNEGLAGAFATFGTHAHLGRMPELHYRVVPPFLLNAADFGYHSDATGSSSSVSAATFNRRGHPQNLLIRARRYCSRNGAPVSIGNGMVCRRDTALNRHSTDTCLTIVIACFTPWSAHGKRCVTLLMTWASRHKTAVLPAFQTMLSKPVPEPTRGIPVVRSMSQRRRSKRVDMVSPAVKTCFDTLTARYVILR